MKGFRENTGRAFSRAARFIQRRPLAGLMAVLLVTTALAAGMARLELDTSYSGFLEEDDPTLREYRDFRLQFGQNTAVFVVLEPKEVFDLGFLERLGALHRDLEREVPDLDDITSLLNVRATRAQGEVLIVEELGESWPRREEDLPGFRRRVLAEPLYRNQIISADGRLTGVILKINTADPVVTGARGGAPQGREAEAVEETLAQGFGSRAKPPRREEYLADRGNRPAFRAIQDVVERYRSPETRIHLAGALVVTETLKKHLKADMLFLIQAALAVIGGCLLLAWRRLAGLLGPLAVVVSALAATLGLMGWLGVRLKLPTLVLPTIVLTAGVGDSIHILALFYQEAGKRLSPAEALTSAFRRSGPALLITTLTTAAGLVSFAASRVTPVAELAVFAAVGVILALLYTAFLLPALVALIPFRPVGPGGLSGAPSRGRVIPWIARLTTSRPKAVLGLSLALLLLAGAGLGRLGFSHDILAWMPAEGRVRQDHQVVDQRMGGTIFIEAVIDTRAEDGLHDPALLRGLDGLARGLREDGAAGIPVGRSFFLGDLVREIHRALTDGDPEKTAIPDNRRLVSQELLLFEAAGGDYLPSLVDSTFRLGRLSLTVPTRDALDFPPFLEQLEKATAKVLGGSASVVWTGTAALIGRTVLEAVDSIPLGYGTALVMITAFMILLMGRLKLGLISMIPNLFPLLAALGLMGWLGLDLDMTTMLFVTIAGGLAVDDTAHFMHHFRSARAAGAGLGEAVEKTLTTAGRAMVVTSLVLGLGFLTCGLASLSNLLLFGLMSALSIFLALAADFFLSPALMALIDPDRPGRNR